MTSGSNTPARPRALVAFYAIIGVLTTITLVLSFDAGSSVEAEQEVAGRYLLEPAGECIGDRFDLRQSGQFVTIEVAQGEAGGNLRFEDGQLSGTVDCEDGGEAEIEARAADRGFTGSIGGEPFEPTRIAEAPSLQERNAVAPSGIGGHYELVPSSVCLGSRLEFHESGGDFTLEATGAEGEVSYEDGHLEGTVTCEQGGEAELSGEALGREIEIEIEGGQGGPLERVVAEAEREFGATLAVFFGAIVVVMFAARALGWVATRIGQPRVMGEVVAGIVLGPTVFGALAPQVQALVFPTDLITTLGVVANLGLIFYMFMVGIELDPNQLRGRLTQALTISNASVLIPMALGVAVAVPVYELVGPDGSFVAFALFMGVAMSITAFPVLARILVERRMLTRPVGATALAAAAIDDVTAWFLIALATAVAVAGSFGDVAITIGLAIAFCLVMYLGARPLMARVSTAFDEIGRIPVGWLAAIFAGVLLSAYATEQIGIALIFGAFVMGTIMPRHAELTEDVTKRMEDFVVVLLLPLFFAYTGLRTNVGLLDQPELWLLSGALLLVAILGKLAGAALAARLTGFDWRESAVVGTLMNTRGLTELIVLNLALELGVISEALFAALVMMALITTFMAGPLLRLLDPRNELGAPVEDEFEQARAEARDAHPELEVPDRSIVLAPQTTHGLSELMRLGALLASSEPRRECIVAKLITPTRGAASGVRAGLQTEALALAEASAEVNEAREELVAQGVAARAVAFISADPGADLLRISDSETLDLVLLDGRRPLLGEAVPGGQVGAVLRDAPSDVAVLVAREDQTISLGPDQSPILVPFGGAEHDWAALELGAWLSAASGTPLSLLGAAGSDQESSRVSLMLGDAAMLVQRQIGVPVSPVLSEPGRDAITRQSTESSVVVVGLASDWQKEGLGATRRALAESHVAPLLFVRRGSRPGTLAGPEDVTKFGWSSTRVGMGM